MSSAKLAAILSWPQWVNNGLTSLDKFLDADTLDLSQSCSEFLIYRQTSNITCTLVGNITVDNSDVVGASPVGAAPTTSSLST